MGQGKKKVWLRESSSGFLQFPRRGVQKPNCDLSKLNTWLYIGLTLTVVYIFLVILLFVYCNTIDTLSNWYN